MTIITVLNKAAAVATLKQKKMAQALQVLVRELEQGGIRIAGDARRKAPVAFGFLRANIFSSKVQRRGSLFFVEAGTRGVKYAPFVEFGTGPRGATSTVSKDARAKMAEMGYKHGPRGGWPPAESIGRWMRRKGIDPSMTFAVQRALRRQGTKAQPFLFPAFEAQRKPIRDLIATALKRALESV